MNGNGKPKTMAADEFLSLVSHELKNPLTSIAGYTTFAAEAVRNQDRQAALENLEIVRCETRRVLKLTEDLLDMAQVREGKFSLVLGPVDLPAIVCGIASRYTVLTERRIEVNAGRFPTITGDGVRLEQVLENLVSNATKYSPPDTPIRIDLTATQLAVTVSVWNGGRTIPPEKMNSLFRRFSRVAPNRNDGNGDAVRGNGLGLYISKQIVEKHGGTIRATSRDGEGTRFTVELPRPQPDVAN